MSSDYKRRKSSQDMTKKSFFRIRVKCPGNLKLYSLQSKVSPRVQRCFNDIVDIRWRAENIYYIVHFEDTLIEEAFEDFAEEGSELFPILQYATYSLVCCESVLRNCTCNKREDASSEASEGSVCMQETIMELETAANEDSVVHKDCISPVVPLDVPETGTPQVALQSSVPVCAASVPGPEVPVELQDKMRRMKPRPHPATRIDSDNFEPRTCLLFKPKEGKSLHEVPAREVGQFFRNLQPSPMDIRKVRGGILAVDFPIGENLQVFLDLQLFVNIPVTVCPPEQRSGSSGVIHGNFSGTEEVRELYSYHENSNPTLLNVSKLGSSNTYRLDFEHSLPDSVRLCFVIYKVSQYFREPTRCFKCQRFGHRAADCRSQLTCSICAGRGHDYKTCTVSTPKCANCGGPHKAFDRKCPHREFHARVIRTSVKKGVTMRQARVEVSRSFADIVRGNASGTEATNQVSSWAASARAPPTPPPSHTGEKMLPLSALPRLFSKVLSAIFPERKFSEMDIQAIIGEATE